MSALGIIGLVLAVVVGLFAILVIVGAARLRGMRKAYQSRVDAVGAPELSGQANFFGQASEGKAQVRGLGTLLLTDAEVAFVQLMPARELRIDRSSITSCRVTRHFLGKTQGRDLLVVVWETNGMGDAAAFDTPNISDWTSRLDPSVS